MTVSDRRTAFRDRELIEFFAAEPELLAIADAYASTQRRYWRRRERVTVWRLGALAAVVVAIAAPTAAFADQIGAIFGLSNSGTPVPTEQFPVSQMSGLKQTGFPVGEVRLLARRAGLGFYVARDSADNFCFGIGFAAGTPSLDALSCSDATSGSFPSRSDPVADLSTLNLNGTSVTRLIGFATDDIVRIAVLNANGNTISSTPVSDNVYEADGLPQTPAAAIVAYNQSNAVVYKRPITTPPVPQPAPR
jgi:hypothetical protein